MKFAGKTILLLLMLSCFSTLHGQDKERLRRNTAKLPTMPDDTLKVKVLNDIGWDTSYDNLAVGLGYLQQGLALAEQLNYDEGIALLSNSIGATYTDMGEFSKAMEAHVRALKITEKMNDKGGLASCYINMALVYSHQGDEKKSRPYLLKALQLYDETGLKRGMAVTYINLGASYYMTDQNDSAIHCFIKGQAIAKELNRPSWEAHCMSGLAQCYSNIGDSVRANTLIKQALAVFDSLQDDYELCNTYSAYAQICTEQANYKKAEQLHFAALDIARKIGMSDMEKTIWINLSEMYEKSGQHAQAYDALQKHMKIKDSLQNESTIRHQQDLEAVYQNEKNQAQIALMKKESALQDTYLTALVVGCLLLLLFLFVLYNRSQLRKRTNIQLASQNAIIEEKNKDITDSINYARRIQEALLPSAALLGNQFPDAFVFYRPRDIVSGDFWWCTEKDGKFLLAVADCTGHGVPGGFMSVMSAAFLSEIINEKGVTQPGEILNLLRAKVISALKQNADNNDNASEVKDGMDISLCSFSPGRVDIACANNPAWIVRNKELKEIPADKFPVGIYHNELKPFTPRHEDLQPGDMIYLFSDGYADQFGGPDGKKFKYRQMKELFVSVSGLPCDAQLQSVTKAFDDWKGANEQVDDVLVIGIRV